MSDTPASTQSRRFNRSVGQSPRLQQGQLLPGDGGWHYPGAEEGQSQPGVRWVCKLKCCICDCSFLLFKLLHLTGIFTNNVFLYPNEVQRVASHFNLQEHHKLELIKQTSSTSLSAGVIMAANGPSNLQHIRFNEITGVFIISRLTVSAWSPPKYMFNLEFPFPQFVIQLWATRALWWAIMRIPSVPAHHWNTQTHSERRGYCVIMKVPMKRKRWQRIHCTGIRVWFPQRHEERQPPVCLFQYVPENLLPVYREKIVPLSDILTPNQFEAEWVQPPAWVQTSGL